MKDPDENIRFVARHYRPGAFNHKEAFRSIAGASRPWWRTRRVAAAAIAIVAISASAALIYTSTISQPVERPQTEVQSSEPVCATAVSHVIDFDNAALPTVVAEIEREYGVKVAGMPQNAADMRLSLHFQGNAKALLEAINEILGTKLTLSE